MNYRNNAVYRKARKIFYYFKHRNYRKQYLLKEQPEIKSGSIILVLHEFFYAGAELLLFNIINEFKNRGIPCTLLACEFGPMQGEFLKLCPVIISDMKNMDSQIDNLLIRGCKEALCNTAVTGDIARKLKEHGIRVISLVHEMGEVLRTDNEWVRKAKNIAIYSDIIVFPSEYVKKSFFKHILVPDTKVIIRNQGIYHSNVENRQFSKDKIYGRYSLNPFDRIVLGAGTANYTKGFDLFIDTAYKCSSLNKKIIFIWIGNMTNKILKKKKKEYKVDNFCNLILPGYVSDKKELSLYFASADLFFLPSRQDSFPSVVLEAMNNSLPVVAFENCGGFTDVIENNVNGYLVSAFDINSVSDQISFILFDDEKRINMGERGRLLVKAYSFEKYCSFLISLLKEIRDHDITE